MIDDLDKTIRVLLVRDLRISNLKVSFESPDAQFRPKVEPPAVNLFLYDVRENHDLRSNERMVERPANGKVSSRPAPIRVDCSYLVTAWVGAGAINSAEDEHRLLSDTMTVLLAYPKLPAEVLQGRLQAQEPSLPTATLQPGRLQSIGEFWQALGGNPKAAFDYTVTIGIQPFAPIVEGLVEEMTLVVEEKSRPPGSRIRRAKDSATDSGERIIERYPVPFTRKR